MIRMIGTYSTAELRSSFLDAIDALGATNAIGICFDVSESEVLATRSAEDVSAMAYFMASYSKRFSRRMALIGSNDFSFGMMRLGSATLEQAGVTSAVFRSECDAWSWIRAGAATQASDTLG